MPASRRDEIRNVAIIAHVDHGKTSLVDGLVWQSALLRDHDYDPERVLAKLDSEREKGITTMPRAISVRFRDARINIVDAPEHAGFGGAVERALRMVEGVVLLVDACEGPLPQTRFVLRKALESGLTPIVVISKIDRPEARPEDALREVRELFVDLDAREEQLNFPVLYCNTRDGLCRRELDGANETLLPLFEEILRTVPTPQFDPEAPLQFLVTALDYDDFLGRLALGRVVNGRLEKGQSVAHCRRQGEPTRCTVHGLFGYEGAARVEVQQAGPGDIVSLTGPESIAIGESLADAERPQALPPLEVDEPTIALELSANDSPTAGLDGMHASAAKLRERLFKELLTNVSIRVDEADAAGAFRVCGRSELQLAILIEMIRREGYEMLVSRPSVLTREEEGQRQEPMELVIIDCPERHVGVVTEKLDARKGRMTKMVNHGAGRVRMEFRVPARGLIGFRTEFLADTRGTGIVNHLFDGYDVWQGEIAHRSTGSLVADGPGRCTAHAIEHLQHRGRMFVAPGDEAYEGMIVGENSHPDDLDVNITKQKRPQSEPVPRVEQPMGLLPPRSMSLENALEFLRDDELVEVTPRVLRLRKRVLAAPRRSRSG